MTTATDLKAWRQRFVKSGDAATRAKYRQEVIDLENSNRKLFAQDRNHPAIADPYASLVSVHDGPEPGSSVKALAQFPEEAAVPVIMPIPPELRIGAGLPCTVDKEEFIFNWRIFTENSLQFLKWDNVFAAGGSVLACLAPVPDEMRYSPAHLREMYREKFPASDIDLFIYGLDEASAKTRMEEIYNQIVDAVPFETLSFRTSHAVTIVSQHPYRYIQIVLRLYKSPAEVLTGFDVDCCAVGFNGKDVYCAPRAFCALVTQTNTIDLTRRSPSYEVRLAKYAERGYEIRFPGLKRDCVDPQIYEKGFDKVVGLAKLLLFEELKLPSARFGFKEKQRERKLRPPHENAGGYAALSYSRSRDLKSQGVDASDYQAVFLPYGPKWTARKIANKALKKDYILNNPALMHKFRSTRHHQHPLFFGSMKDVLSDCCGSCPPIPDNIDKEDEGNHFVWGPLTFIVDNPGRQEIGSFNPITDEDWTEGVYVQAGLEPLMKAITADDVEKMVAILEEGVIKVDDRDWLGRTPLLLATFTNAIKCVKALFERGAKISLTLPDGRNPYHICAEYGYSDLLIVLIDQNKIKKQELEARVAAAAAAAAAAKAEGGANEKDEDGEDDEDDYEFVDEKSSGKGTKKGDNEEEEEPEDDVIDLEFKDWDMKMTALHYSCFHGNAKVAQILIENGANVNAMVSMKSGYNSISYSLLQLALLCAEKERGVEVVKLLLKHVKLSQIDANHQNILHELALRNAPDGILLLRDCTSKEDLLSIVNEVDKQG
ncbi:hypothetical protein HDU76_005966, partial [Blyttiomyces sp. JEL0837]